ncbi:hypothetical protein H5410_036073 [Solanum commersonii]|uniref:Uncharacterized protein n=1 Tax=Solanum commersonii TaxID=4109 RepID=A0A9J5Y339_SOLCO|nr:hypothetical protein H5410_036073 [Solanum commersonii]
MRKWINIKYDYVPKYYQTCMIQEHNEQQCYVEEVTQQRKDTEEDEDMEYNIQQINKVGDLSPRHTNSLKNKARKCRPVILLLVKKRSRDRGSNCDQ